MGGILAIIFGIIHYSMPEAGTWIPWLLFIVGIIVGFVAIQEKDLKEMMLASLFIVIISSFSAPFFAGNIGIIGTILAEFMYVYVPVAVIILMKYPFVKK